MRRISIKRLVATSVVALSAILCSAFSGHAAAVPATAAGGVTIAPATLTIDLAKQASQASVSFDITNQYAAPVTLQFAFEVDPQMPEISLADLSKQLSLATTELRIDPGQSASQTVTLTDSTQLAPGGQQLTLVVRQINATAGTVGISSSIRMPVTIVKEEGAVSQLSLGSLEGTGLAFGMPDAIAATLHNGGNMIAIPHGVITVTGPNGRVLRQGTINVASHAVVPGRNFTTTTALNDVGHAFLPGMYRVQISYGLGGDHPMQLASATFLYIAWWHIVTIILLAVGVYATLRYLARTHRKSPSKKKPPASRPVPFGRHAT